MRTYSSKTIGNCLCTLAFAVVGALCALLSAGTLGSYGWDLTEADALVKGGVAVLALIAFVMLGNACIRTYKWIRYRTIMRRRASM